MVLPASASVDSHPDRTNERHPRVEARISAESSGPGHLDFVGKGSNPMLSKPEVLSMVGHHPQSLYRPRWEDPNRFSPLSNLDMEVDLCSEEEEVLTEAPGVCDKQGSISQAGMVSPGAVGIDGVQYGESELLYLTWD
nr:hypothetical protein CFP56_14754 [Quercus suber]